LSSAATLASPIGDARIGFVISKVTSSRPIALSSDLCQKGAWPEGGANHPSQANVSLRTMQETLNFGAESRKSARQADHLPFD
jgi:hypothetical protein